MKNLFTLPFFLILIGLSSSLPVFGIRTDSLYCIEITGQVAIPKSDPSRNYKLILLCNNVVVDSGEVVDDEQFLLRVKKNSLYSIRIFKQGYPPMVVSLNTGLSELTKQKFNFTETYFVDRHGFNLSLSLLNQPLLAEIDTKDKKD